MHFREMSRAGLDHRRFARFDEVMSLDNEMRVELGGLDERHRALRLQCPQAIDAMGSSLRRHGQLTSVAVVREGDDLALLDGLCPFGKRA